MFLRYLPVLILFVTGWNLALPIADPGVVPWWATPITPFHGVFLDNALFVLYLAAVLVTGRSQGRRRLHGIGTWTLGLILLLSFLGCISNLINLQPIREMGEAARLALLGVYFAAAVGWANTHGPAVILRTFLLGILAAGLLNLYFTYHFQIMGPFGVPALLGQNGPGGSLGLAAILSCMLLLIAKGRLDTIAALAAFGVSVTAAAISHSKLGALMGMLGVVSFGFVLCHLAANARTRKTATLVIGALVIAVFLKSEAVVAALLQVKTVAEYKFSDGIVGENEEARKAYFYGVAEIVAANPLFGVGYGGFYKAYAKANASNKTWDEDPSAVVTGTANPHSAVLYYAAANGVPGLVVCVLLGLALFRMFLKAFVPLGVAGGVLVVCLGAGCVIHAFTLPSLFSTAILYVPAAVACSMIALRTPQLHAKRMRAVRQPFHEAAATARAAQQPGVSPL